jgi:hypothetical protein
LDIDIVNSVRVNNGEMGVSRPRVAARRTMGMPQLHGQAHRLQRDTLKIMAIPELYIFSVNHAQEISDKRYLYTI